MSDAPELTSLMAYLAVLFEAQLESLQFRIILICRTVCSPSINIAVTPSHEIDE